MRFPKGLRGLEKDEFDKFEKTLAYVLECYGHTFMHIDEMLWTTHQVALWLHLTPRRINQLLKEGCIPQELSFIINIKGTRHNKNYIRLWSKKRLFQHFMPEHWQQVLYNNGEPTIINKRVTRGKMYSNSYKKQKLNNIKKRWEELGLEFDVLKEPNMYRSRIKAATGKKAQLVEEIEYYINPEIATAMQQSINNYFKMLTGKTLISNCNSMEEISKNLDKLEEDKTNNVTSSFIDTSRVDGVSNSYSYSENNQENSEEEKINMCDKGVVE